MGKVVLSSCLVDLPILSLFVLGLSSPDQRLDCSLVKEFLICKKGNESALRIRWAKIGKGLWVGPGMEECSLTLSNTSPCSSCARALMSPLSS